MTTLPLPRAPLRGVTVSIVSHGQIELIRPLLAQLDRFCHEHIGQVLLTCNLPEQLGVLPALRFPLELLHNARPQGFGANHNAAFLRHCRTPWFLVLNPDIRLSSDVLGQMLAEPGSETGLLAPRVLEPGKQHPEPHRRLITPVEIVRRRKPAYRAPLAPVWLPGLFMLFRSTAYRAVHGFDERYFMYGEDVDISARLRLAGWYIHICEDQLVLHEARRASHADGRHLRWHLASLLRLWTSAAFWRYRRLLCRSR